MNPLKLLKQLNFYLEHKQQLTREEIVALNSKIVECLNQYNENDFLDMEHRSVMTALLMVIVLLLLVVFGVFCR